MAATSEIRIVTTPGFGLAVADIVTEGVLNLFADLCDDAPREADDTSEQRESLPDNVIPMPRNK
jgi:hypothetical protein